MQVKKILPCLDIRGGAVVVGQQFKNVKKVADPLTLAQRYDAAGADELVIYDIAATLEGRQVFGKLLTDIRKATSLPLILGGGIATVADVERALSLGANRVSINSGALADETLLAQAVKAFGSDAILLSIDVGRVGDDYHVFSAAGQKDTGRDAIDWAKAGEAAGVGQLVLNSTGTDGMKEGFDIPLLQDFAAAVSLPLVASGGAGTLEDFVKVFRAVPTVTAGLAASVFHFGEISVKELKQYLAQEGIPVA